MINDGKVLIVPIYRPRLGRLESTVLEKLTKYYVVLVRCAILVQMQFIGLLGMIFCLSSLFNGVFIALLLPLTEVAGVIAFNEKFTAEKGMALALCLSVSPLSSMECML